jgi:hypothetical protein
MSEEDTREAATSPATTKPTFLAAQTSLTLPCLVVEEDQPDEKADTVEVSQFSPTPIVMSRGGSSASLSSTEGDGTSGLFCSSDKRKSKHQIDHGLVTPTRHSSSGDEQQQQGKIFLQANHQKSMSSRKLNELNGGSSHISDYTVASSEELKSSRSVNGVLLSPITGAWGWIQKQREKRRQAYLSELAEQQVQILKQAQKSDPNVNFTVVAVDCFVDNINASSSSQHQEDYDDDDISWVPPVRCVQEQINKDGPTTPRSLRRGDSVISTDPTKPVPFLLDHSQMHDIARYVLPKGIAFCQWKRLYSLTRDGDSFFQCLRLCGSEPKTLLVLKTTRGAVFGGYADSEWEVQSHQNGSFHGSAQACLFSFAIPPDMLTDNSNRQPKSTTNVRVFPWTGANRYIQYTDKSENHRMLAFGGGGQEGAFGLCVEQDFQLGSTGPCDTFGNIPLCDQENFNILDLEIWGFLTGQF